MSSISTTKARWIISILFVLAGGWLSYVGMVGQHAEAAVSHVKEQALPVSVAQPTVRRITEWDEYTGRFEAANSVEVRARISGYLTEVTFSDGQMVAAGDLLFRIDPRPFDAALAAAQAELRGAQATLTNAQREYDRGNDLRLRQAISVELAERRMRALHVAEAEVAAAQAKVTRAQLDREFTEVRAPIAGRISDDFVSQGNLIVGGAAGGTLLTTIVSLDPIHFEFTVSEADHLKYTRLLQSGERPTSRDNKNPVQVRLLDETTFTHEGYMSFVDNRLDVSTGTVRGRATLANPNDTFTPGMFGRLRLIGSGEYDALMLPDNVIQTDQSDKFVWIVNTEMRAERRYIALGPLVEGMRVVRSGLKPDDAVLVNGTQFVGVNTLLAPESQTDLVASAH